MPTQHKNITEADLHEPKGVSTAAVGTFYKANGAGSGTWSKDPYGFTYFENISTPYTVIYPSTYTKIAPTTIAPGVSYLVTEGTNARLTYLGSGEVMDISCTLSADQASGADRDLQFSIYKNGIIVPGSTTIITAATGSKRSVTLSAAVSLATNDYIECYVKNNGASGDVRVYTFSLFLDPN